MQRIFIIRHAEAENTPQSAERDDTKRALTKRGIRRMRKGVQGLSTLVDNLAIIATSPLTRAIQTAEIIATAFPRAKLVSLSDLAPGFDQAKLLTFVVGNSGTIALIGHEPDLSNLVSYLATTNSREIVRLKKGGVCCLEFASKVQAGKAKISWLLTSKQLSKLG
ncbi:MAG: histidine phosphatase family protein [Gammaproteobacteria bacterium]